MQSQVVLANKKVSTPAESHTPSKVNSSQKKSVKFAVDESMISVNESKMSIGKSYL